MWMWTRRSTYFSEIEKLKRERTPSCWRITYKEGDIRDVADYITASAIYFPDLL